MAKNGYTHFGISVEQQRYLEIIRKVAEISEEIEHSWNSFSTLIALRHQYKTFRIKFFKITNVYRLLPLVVISQDALVTDPRDKIYSLLGLAQETFGGEILDCDLNTLIVDYNATVEDVYSSFVKAVVKASKRLDILALCIRDRGRFVQRTWTPDWTVHSWNLNSSILYQDLRGWQDLTYNVDCGNDCVARFSTDLSTLTVSGLVWDKIVLVLPTKIKDKNEIQILRNSCQGILTAAKENGKQGSAYGSDIITISVLLGTLLLNRKDIESQKDASKDWIKEFTEWMKDKNTESLVKSTTDTSIISSHTPDGKLESSRYIKFWSIVYRTMEESSLILTADGFIGRWVGKPEAGDLVCVFLGCAMPMVLRPIKDRYELVGEALLAGIMRGETMTALDEGKKVLQEFQLH
jgi:hypothetical protein